MENEDPEELKERQENEVEALKAIFNTDFKDLRERAAWKLSRPPSLQLHLTPENNTQGYTEAHVSVGLRVTCGARYPLTRPQLELVEPRGLGQHQLVDLTTSLEELATQLEGTEMVFQLAGEVGQFLAKNNKAAFRSMAEEMEARRMEKEAVREKGMNLLAESKRQAVAQKVAERQLEILEEQKRLEEEDKRKRSSVLEVEDGATKSEHQSPSILPPGLRYRQTRVSICEEETAVVSEKLNLSLWGQAREVWRGKILGRNSLNQPTFCGFSPDTGQVLAIASWNLGGKVGNRKVKWVDQTENSIARQLLGLEQEMNSLQRVRHQNLVRYAGLSHLPGKEGGLVVYVCQEFVAGYNLSLHLQQGRKMELQLLRAVLEGVLGGLSHLHGANIVHRDIRDTSVYVENASGRVKLADFSLDSRVRDMFEEVEETQVEDLFPQAPGRGGKKGDVHRVGVLGLSLALGFVVTDQRPSLPRHLLDSLRNLLNHCLVRDEKERWTADQLLEHPFIKEPLVVGLSLQPVNASHNCHQPSSPQRDEMKTSPTRRSPSPTNVPAVIMSGQGQSRLHQDFDILSWIGRGGFGDVVKVRNKLNDQQCVIKRIRLNPADIATNRKILREVNQTISGTSC